MSTTALPYAGEYVENRPTFIVQNVTMGHHSISDIGLNFAPLEAKDLTWEDPTVIRKSRNLDTSLKLGYLKKISQAEWDELETARAARERAELLNQQQNVYQDVDAEGGGKHVADVIDLENRSNSNSQHQVSTAGHANDPLSYAIALDIEQARAEARGERLTASEFAERVVKDPGLIAKILSQKTASVSGDPRRGVAFVATAPGGDGRSNVSQINMTNANRETYIAGADQAGYTVHNPNHVKDALDLNAQEQAPIAEEIDLNREASAAADAGEARGKGSVRRRAS